MREKRLGGIGKGKAGEAFTQAVLAITVNTGLVSHMVEDCYNCALAHAVCYGLDLIPGVAERFLHGDLVGIEFQSAGCGRSVGRLQK